MAFGTKRQKADREAAQAEQKAAGEAIAKPGPGEARAEKRIAQWDEDLASSKDVSAYDAMKPYLNLYQAATDNQMADRQGTGILSMADRMNPAAAANYKTYMGEKRRQDAAGKLEGAFAMTDASMRGDNFAYSQMYNNRNLGRAGIANQRLGMEYGRPGVAQQIGQIAGPIMMGAAAF